MNSQDIILKCTNSEWGCIVTGVLPKYFSSEWSFAQFRVPEETRAIVAFGPQKNTLIVVCANGRYDQPVFSKFICH